MVAEKHWIAPVAYSVAKLAARHPFGGGEKFAGFPSHSSVRKAAQVIDSGQMAVTQLTDSQLYEIAARR
jgi:hypothetical protein